jgi:hypothetical protein
MPSRNGRGQRSSPPENPNGRRDRLANAAGVVTICLLAWVFYSANGLGFLMPGPLLSGHAAIEDCGTCHTKTGTGKLSWLHGLIAADPRGDSKACLGCHKMPNTAFNAHSAPADDLDQSTRRLAKIAAAVPASARFQKNPFPVQEVMATGMLCATCHQEHRGVDLKAISNAKCQSCHTLQFDSFDGSHPDFSNYPFERRTRIIYDHDAHFGKHFPEIAAKKDPAKTIPASCSTCHSSQADRRLMAVVPFANTCSGCHLDQILGKERASGPKGIAFLTLPGVDVATLKSKADIGEWPGTSEAAVTPFMKVMIGRNERGRALLKTIGGLDLLDLSQAKDAQIAAVASFIWEIKGLYYALVSGKASDVLASLDLDGGSKLNPAVLAALTASLPRDVIIAAQREWLPNLGTEIANHKEPAAGSGAPATGEGAPATGEGGASGWTSSVTESQLAAQVPPSELPEGVARDATGTNSKSQGQSGAANPQRLAEAWKLDESGRLIKSDEPPPAATSGAPAASSSEPGPSGGPPPDAAASPATGADAGSAAPSAPVGAAIISNVDAESWAEYGGWYRQDYAILYRPATHLDTFIRAWLDLAGPRAPRGDKGPAAQLFDVLAGKDAQGQCTKCHSVDDVAGKGRFVNWRPASIATKQRRFTNFVHEPHFGVMQNRGCLTCHKLEKGAQVRKSYEQGNPRSFVSNFAGVKKDLCQTCHKQNVARQDCVLCHRYHVTDVNTPIISTKIPKP